MLYVRTQSKLNNLSIQVHVLTERLKATGVAGSPAEAETEQIQRNREVELNQIKDRITTLVAENLEVSDESHRNVTFSSKVNACICR